MLPIVLYNGDRRWTAKTSLAEQRGPLPAELQRFQLNASYVLLDESRVPASELPPDDNVAALVVRIEQAAHPTDVARWMQRVFHHLAADEFASLRDAIMDWVRRVVAKNFGQDEPRLLHSLTNLEGPPMLASMLRRERDALLEKGRTEGTRRFATAAVTIGRGLGRSS